MRAASLFLSKVMKPGLWKGAAFQGRCRQWCRRSAAHDYFPISRELTRLLRNRAVATRLGDFFHFTQHSASGSVLG